MNVFISTEYTMDNPDVTVYYSLLCNYMKGREGTICQSFPS